MTDDEHELTTAAGAALAAKVVLTTLALWVGFAWLLLALMRAARLAGIA